MNILFALLSLFLVPLKQLPHYDVAIGADMFCAYYNDKTDLYGKKADEKFLNKRVLLRGKFGCVIPNRPEANDAGYIIVSGFSYYNTNCAVAFVEGFPFTNNTIVEGKCGQTITVLCTGNEAADREYDKKNDRFIPLLDHCSIVK